MKARRILSLVAVGATTIVLAASSEDVAACSCMAPDAPLAELAKADAVFEARVESIDTTSYRRFFSCGKHVGSESVTHTTVLRSWKGATPGAQLDVIGGIGGGMCGYSFQPGTTYVVYGYKNADGVLSATKCSRTAPSSGAAADLAALGPGSK